MASASILPTIFFFFFAIPCAAMRIQTQSKANSTREDWEVTVFWTRHGMSCANAMATHGWKGKLCKNLFKDPTLTDCGVLRSIHAGDRFAEWDRATKGYGNGMPGSLDRVFSSNLLRAIETALFQFGRVNSERVVWPLPHIEESGFTLDNTRTKVDVQAQFFRNFSGVPNAGPLDAGVVGRKTGINWEDFSFNFSKAERSSYSGSVSADGYDKELHSTESELPSSAAPVDLGSHGKKEKRKPRIERFYDVLSGLMPDLIEKKKAMDANSRSIRIGIVSHSKFMLETFEDVCGVDSLPANNDIWAITYKMTTGSVPKLSPTTCLPLSKAEQRSEGRLPSMLLPTLPKRLCGAESERCAAQIQTMPKASRRLLEKEMKIYDHCQCTVLHPVSRMGT